MGSNLDHPALRLDEALQRLSRVIGLEIVTVSSYYQTPPLGILEQPWFVNAVARLCTQLAPEKLMESLLGIEESMGRVRREHWGPRIIDLDLLLYDDLIIQTDFLALPHPQMHLRGFVLVPLAEIAPETTHPRFHQKVTQLLEQLEPDDLRADKIQRIFPAP